MYVHVYVQIKTLSRERGGLYSKIWSLLHMDQPPHRRRLYCVAVCCSVLQCVAACCSVLQRVVVCCSVLQFVAVRCSVLQRVAVVAVYHIIDSPLHRRMLYCVAVCCSVLQCVAVCCVMLQCVEACCSVLQYAALCFSELQWVLVSCSVLQCVAVCLMCCSVLQCVAVFLSFLFSLARCPSLMSLHDICIYIYMYILKLTSNLTFKNTVSVYICMPL